MQHPDEGMIHAWLDGELRAEEAHELESHVAACEECSAKVAEARGLIAASSRVVSALDIVPAGVIPIAKPKRGWYSTVQFRAAAGFIVVAGASLLLLNRGEQRDAMRAVVTAPKASEMSEQARVIDTSRTMISSGAAASLPPAAPKEAAQAKVLKAKAAYEKKTADAVADMTAGNDAMGAAAPATAGAVAAPPPPPVEKQSARDAGVTLNEVTVTGIAAAAPLKLVSSDTTQGSVKSVYELTKGVEVSLVEAPAARRNFTAATAKAARERAVPLSAPVAQSVADGVNTISWTKGDKTYVLSGRVSVSELQAARQRLPEDKR